MDNSPHPLILRAREAFGRGDLPAAEASTEERLKTAGRDVSALELRALIQQRRGQFAQAACTLDTVIGIDPSADWAYNGLIQLFLGHGKLSDAEQIARVALRTNPRNPQAHNLFGFILSEMNNLPAGEWHFRRALELAGPQAPFLMNLGLNLMKQGRTTEADGYFSEAHQLDPRDIKTLGYWSTLYEARGDLARAQELLQRAEAIGSPGDVSLLRAKYLARAGKPQDALETYSGDLGGSGHLERAHLLDRLGRFDEAWEDFVVGKGKLARDNGMRYDGSKVEALFASYKRFFTRANIELLPHAGVRADVPQPLFIVGFPRSGTTLIEQILCSHSSIRAGGELPILADIRDLTRNLLPDAAEYPESLAQMWTADRRYVAALLRDYYLARAEAYGLLQPGKTFFTDKMPFNEIDLPLLKMIFPRAKIIHAVRHPLDVCVSMLANLMNHGFGCAYRIEDITHYLAAVFDLTEHYRGVLQANEFVLQYEALIADQESLTRCLFEYLELPFEESCLRFHENRRYAPTPSYAQVSQKLNDASVNRHAHYARHLQPHAQRLESLMARYGYR